MESKQSKEIKKLKLQILIVVFGVSALVIGTSFAIFSQYVNSTKGQAIKTGSIYLVLNETPAGLNAELVAKTDAAGLALNPCYTFTVQNSGANDASYIIYLQDNTTQVNSFQAAGGTILDDQYIKFGLEKNDTEIGCVNSTCSDLETINRVLDSGTISSGTTNSYELRLWLNFAGLTDAEEEALIDATAFFEIKVTAEQTTT